MDWLSSNSMFMMESSLNFLWTKQNTILDNISNVETPGYKTKYVTFEESLRDRLRIAQSTGAPAARFRSAINGATLEVHEADNETTRLDENGVNLTEQAVELSRTAYQMQYAIQAINGDFSALRTAITG